MPHHNRRGDDRPQHQSERPAPLASRKTEHEHKTFFTDLHSNHRGPFIKFTERSGDKRNTVLIPVEAIRQIMNDWSEVLQEGGVQA